MEQIEKNYFACLQVRQLKKQKTEGLYELDCYPYHLYGFEMEQEILSYQGAEQIKARIEVSMAAEFSEQIESFIVEINEKHYKNVPKTEYHYQLEHILHPQDRLQFFVRLQKEHHSKESPKIRINIFQAAEQEEA